MQPERVLLPPMPEIALRRSSRSSDPPVSSPLGEGLPQGPLKSPGRRSPRIDAAGHLDSFSLSPLPSPGRRSPQSGLESSHSSTGMCDVLPQLNLPDSSSVFSPANSARSPAHGLREDVSSKSLEELLQRGFAVIEQLFRELDTDRCGAIPYPQMRAQLESRGLQDASKLDELWRTVIDKDHNNKVDMAEFFVVLYMWRSRGLGSYRKLFQYNSQSSHGAKDAMEALERYYRKYDADNSGYLSKAEVDNFFRERLPKVSTKFMESYFRTDHKLSFSQFMKLLYVSFGGTLDDFLVRPDAQKAPEESALWRELVDLFTTLEDDFQDLADGRPVTLEDLLDPATHMLQRIKAPAGQACDICTQPAAYHCPFAGCTQNICPACYNGGVVSHRCIYNGPDKEAVVAFVRSKFQRVDIDMSGALDFFEYTCFCFLCCDKMNYATLCKSSHNPAIVKKGLMCVSQNFKNYDRERTHSLSWDDISLFCKESFGSVPRRATDTFSKLAGAGKEIKLMAFFAFLYRLVMPNGKHIYNYCLPKPPGTHARIVTVRPDTQPRGQLPAIPCVDASKVEWQMQLGKGGQSTAWKVVYEGCTLVAKRPLPRTSSAALEVMLRAAKLQAKFNHQHITRVVGVHETKPVCILMELCEGGDVTALWSHSSGLNPILPPLQWRLAYELAEALNVLHTSKPPVMHRDVKGSNVFLDKDFHVLLADFDLATEEPTASDTCGTPGYMGPEVLHGHIYDHRCDVFAYGGFLYEVTHGCFPFSKETSFDGFHAKVKAMIDQGIRPQISPTVPERMRSLMQSCWQADPSSRPSMVSILSQLRLMKADFQH
eukprot:EG_transcript_2876